MYLLPAPGPRPTPSPADNERLQCQLDQATSAVQHLAADREALRAEAEQLRCQLLLVGALPAAPPHL